MDATSRRDEHLCYCHLPMPPNAGRRKRATFLSRIRAALMPGGQCDASRQMSRLLSQTGGRLTDDVERQLMEQLTGNRNFRL
jgi:hypothetical protein